jgi:hypothetical protein
VDLNGIGFDDVDWIHMAQDRVGWQVLVNMEMNIWVQLKVGYTLPSLAAINFSGRTLLHGVIYPW